MQQPTTDTALDAALAPLDDICRGPAPQPPTIAQHDRAYGLALLAAELIGRAKTGYLYEYLQAAGLDAGQAQTIARAFASALTRVAGWVEARSGVME